MCIEHLLSVRHGDRCSIYRISTTQICPSVISLAHNADSLRSLSKINQKAFKLENILAVISFKKTGTQIQR